MTYVNLASCHLKLGRLDRALEYAEQAVSLAPNVAQARVTKARILARMKRLAEAAESMAMAVSLDPQNAAFRVDLANLYLALGRFHDAVGQAEEAVQQASTSVSAHLLLCRGYLRLGDLVRADAALDTARGLAPDHPQVAALTDRLKQLRNR